MLEKQGKVVLTDEDLQEYNRGQVSSRVKETWGFSLDDLKDVIATKQYITIKTKDVQ
jgi:hypothetical protein